MKKGKNTNSLIDFLDSVFTVNGEMIENNGEDSYMYSVNDDYGIIGVFDGCGGLGSRKYTEYNNKSGAYISSRVTSKIVLNWFEKISHNADIQISGNTIDSLCSELKETIIKGLNEYSICTRFNGIKGSMTKSLPTTASIILFSNKKSALYSSYIWAGDSRGFILKDSGLTQITKDDIENEADALENISDDGKLTNVISAEGDFNLNNRILNVKDSGILITASDGCFGYFSTPMEFEFMLLDTMQGSNNVDEWKYAMSEYIKKYTADDYTMAFTIFGYKSFKKMKKLYLDRYMLLKDKYISKLELSEQADRNQLWNEYKVNYYRGV